MKLSELIKNTDVISVTGNKETDISDIAYNASSIERGMCFVAIKGTKVDGHDFVGEAIKRGASVVVSEWPVDSGEAVNVVVKNSRAALALMSAAFFGEPSGFMTLIGVTGTNGKTTITYLLEAILREAGGKPGVIGTIEYRFCDSKEPAPHTTPESYDLQRLLAKMAGAGVSACAMEVSSHALAQDRVDGCHFDAAVFTNLSHEHLDYHCDMDSYFEAKVVLFEELLAKSSKKDVFAVINIDDKYGSLIAKRCPVPVVRYGFKDNADVRCERLSFDKGGLKIGVDGSLGSFECSSQMLGRFNAYNILAAAAVALKMGVDAGTIARAVSSLEAVPGRFESIMNNRGLLAIVDYAHKPDAMENVLSNAREMTRDGGRLITVFGCGGDRDRGKRPVMGGIAAKMADVVIVTSDNPRTEEPNAIIEEIMTGVTKNIKPLKNGKGYEVIPDRRKAIEEAVGMAEKGDVIVVAGKGHENYQILGTKRIHFDDREVLKECLKKTEAGS